ncbi:hypothetical protein [Streptomyces sp. NPDC005799]|uniref:hypothetical protein n=1 Tax=Streptomyces sp. NPDC005799 TaxID=3154678 RepID=UPI0033CBE8A6
MHAHRMPTGVLFASTVCRPDLVRRRWSPVVRGSAPAAAGAAHAVLVKSLYASAPPAPVTATDLHSGAQWTY